MTKRFWLVAVGLALLGGSVGFLARSGRITEAPVLVTWEPSEYVHSEPLLDHEFFTTESVYEKPGYASLRSMMPIMAM